MANNLERAKNIIDARREKAELDAQQRKLELEAVSPELKELNRNIARAGLAAVKLIGTGDAGVEVFERLSKEAAENRKRRAEVLAELGLPEDALNVHYTCPLCEDTGIRDGGYCECFKAIVRKLQYDALCSGTPADKSTFENFRLEYYDSSVREHMTQVYNYCRAWAEDFDRQSNSILLYGNTGLGKTHLSLAMANTVLAKGYSVVYASAGSLFSKLEKESFGRLNSDESPEEAVLSCDLLILDDLGSEYTKPFTVAKFYDIINNRILRGLPTVISTNLMYDEIGDRYNPRVYSRIIGEYQMLEFLGSDIRQIKNDR